MWIDPLAKGPAWGTAEFVTLADGTLVHWTGRDWSINALVA
jgi:hypothetical protein